MKLQFAFLILVRCAIFITGRSSQEDSYPEEAELPPNDDPTSVYTNLFNALLNLFPLGK